MINLQIISAKYGDRTIQVTKEQAFEYRNQGYAVVQGEQVVHKLSDLQDGQDATLVPQLAGG